MAFQFNIATGTGVPIYKQLVDQAKAAVASADLTEGDPLPSIRVLAELLVVNPNTVAKAYNEMTLEGLIVTSPGKGFFVAPRRQMLTRDERKRRLDAAVEAFAHEVVLLEFSREGLLEAVERRLKSMEPAGS
jgi:GntR family transcriptional regulator